MNLKIKHSLVAIFSVCFLLATLFVPVRINKIEEINNIRFGCPAPFISQDFSKNNSDFQFFPRYQKFEFKEISQIKDFFIVNFVISLAVFFIFLESLIYFLEIIDFKLRNYFSKEK